MADRLLDATGLRCPLPILKARKAIGGVAAGGTLEVLATDPGSVADFPAFCKSTGDELVESTTVEPAAGARVYRFLIRRAA